MILQSVGNPGRELSKTGSEVVPNVDAETGEEERDDGKRTSSRAHQPEGEMLP